MALATGSSTTTCGGYGAGAASPDVCRSIGDCCGGADAACDDLVLHGTASVAPETEGSRAPTFAEALVESFAEEDGRSNAGIVGARCAGASINALVIS